MFGLAELLECLVVAAAAGVQQAACHVHMQPEVRPGVCLQGPFGAPQPPLALVEVTQPHHRAGEHYHRGCDHRFRAPAVAFGERDRLAAAPPDRGERVEDQRCEPEPRQAGDFQVRPADLPGQDGALPEVAFSVRQPKRPRLGDPQVHQRHRPQVVAQRDVLVGLPGDRGSQEFDLFDDAGQVTAPPGQRQLQRRDRYPQAPLAVRRRCPGMRLSDRQVRGRLVQASPGKVNCRAHQGQLGGVRAWREGPQQRLHGLRLPVEGQAERMVGQQPGRISPVARRLRVPDDVDDLALQGEPSGGSPVQHRYFRGQRPAQLQPQEIREQVVVAKPGPLGVQRFDESVGVLEAQQDPFRARSAGQQVGQLAVDPIEQGGAQQQILDVGRLAVQHLGEQVLGDHAVAAGELRDEPLRVGVISQGDRREPQARRPPLGPLVQQRDPGLRQHDARGVEELAGFALGKAQVGRADLG